MKSTFSKWARLVPNIFCAHFENVDFLSSCMSLCNRDTLCLCNRDTLCLCNRDTLCLCNRDTLCLCNRDTLCFWMTYNVFCTKWVEKKDLIMKLGLPEGISASRICLERSRSPKPSFFTICFVYIQTPDIPPWRPICYLLCENYMSCVSLTYALLRFSNIC